MSVDDGRWADADEDDEELPPLPAGWGVTKMSPKAKRSPKKQTAGSRFAGLDGEDD